MEDSSPFTYTQETLNSEDGRDLFGFHQKEESKLPTTTELEKISSLHAKLITLRRNRQKPSERKYITNYERESQVILEDLLRQIDDYKENPFTQRDYILQAHKRSISITQREFYDYIQKVYPDLAPSVHTFDQINNDLLKEYQKMVYNMQQFHKQEIDYILNKVQTLEAELAKARKPKPQIGGFSVKAANNRVSTPNNGTKSSNVSPKSSSSPLPGSFSSVNAYPHINPFTQNPYKLEQSFAGTVSSVNSKSSTPSKTTPKSSPKTFNSSLSLSQLSSPSPSKNVSRSNSQLDFPSTPLSATQLYSSPNGNSNHNPPLSEPSSPGSVTSKGLLLPKVKEFIKEILTFKEREETKTKTQLTVQHFTMEYLNHKFGVKSLVSDWAQAFSNAVERYSKESAEIEAFRRLLRGELDDAFIHILKVVKDTASSHVKWVVKNEKGAKQMTDSEAEAIATKKMSGNFEEEEWRLVIDNMYVEEDARELLDRLERYVQFTRPTMLSNNNNNAVESSNGSIPYTELMEVVLRYQIERRLQFLKRFHRMFVAFDSDNDGALNEEEFSAFSKRISPSRKINQDFDLITFSKCVDAFKDEIIDMNLLEKKSSK